MAHLIWVWCLVPQNATDVYKRLLTEYRDYLALNVYVALCWLPEPECAALC